MKSIIRFLFPELQVIDAVKKHGFIARRNKDADYSVKQRQKTGHTQVQGSGVYQMRENEKETVYSPPALKKDSAPAFRNKEAAGTQRNDISELFSDIRAEIGSLLVGQEKYLDDLCTAFKRPFVTGYESSKPKNVIVVLGSRGTGKRTSIHTITGLLHRKRLMGGNSVLTLDLSLYTTPSEFGVFLSDLYKCLYGKSDIVVFDNFDKCHSSVIDVIQTLTTTGKYILSSRYVVQDNNLVEAAGMLLQNSISELGSNGKYFVFTSEKSEREVLNIFGSGFMDSIGDIIHTEGFNRGELNEISGRIFEKLRIKCLQNLSMQLCCDYTVLDTIAASYKDKSGVHSIEAFVDTNIYRPLAELRLKNMIQSNQQVLLLSNEGEIIARVGTREVSLKDIIPERSSAGLEEVKKELEDIVGIESVKQYILSLEENLKVQSARESAGYKSAAISMHMIFTGNPGTGKTTIARITAKYLKALGVLSQGQLREVTRSDLVGQYVGHTSKLTSDVIKSAIGGVLFIDEAYSLSRDKHDTFGLEAIDTLVKGMEDNRDDLVVILAGYKDEMEEFLKVNPGLKSRFPNVINFEDYTPEEMYEISLITAKSKGYRISEDLREPLIELFEKRQIKGRNDSGNGRLVRNVIEAAILNQSRRLMEDNTAPMDLLTYEDFKFETREKFDLEESLSRVIGLEYVKDFVRGQYRLLIAQEKRKRAGISLDTSQALNMIFSGNPGTGKTTVARLVAGMFREMGLLKSGHLVETDRGGLVAEYVGHTAVKTEEVFRSALGGVLFIDEAYALSDNGSSFGKEAIDTLVKLIEDYRGEIVVILAGYRSEMEDFLKSNSGLGSRFPLKINFPDYSPEELFKITLKMLDEKGFMLGSGVEDLLKEQITQLHRQSGAHSGNGRMVRNYVEEIIRRQSSRIAVNDVPAGEMNLIINDDIAVKDNSAKNFDLERELSMIVGLGKVKSYIRSLSARLRLQRERKKLGLSADTAQTLHMIFKGNPGTGKTMVARTVAGVLYNLGVINTNKLIETDRAGLVAGYVGQTAIKTREKVMEAMDGVLFIDEAYALSQGGVTDFGREAIDTLVKMMDDHRDRIVVILAGYSDDMDRFLLTNAGLKSRFPNIIEFVDYSTEELMQISGMLFKSKGYELSNGAREKLERILDKARHEPQFGNGRYVRNLFERSVNNQALRLSTDMDLTREELITITDEDIEGV